MSASLAENIPGTRQPRPSRLGPFRRGIQVGAGVLLAQIVVHSLPHTLPLIGHVR